jgi:hypothetical protein
MGLNFLKYDIEVRLFIESILMINIKGKWSLYKISSLLEGEKVFLRIISTFELKVTNLKLRS